MTETRAPDWKPCERCTSPDLCRDTVCAWNEPMTTETRAPPHRLERLAGHDDIRGREAYGESISKLLFDAATELTAAQTRLAEVERERDEAVIWRDGYHISPRNARNERGGGEREL